MSTRANQLADRLERGAALLAAFARELTDAQWNTKVLPDSRTVGVLVHHVANLYPIEMDVIDAAVAGNAIVDVTWEVVAGINREHAKAFANVTKTEALEFLERTSRDAARRIRAFSDEDLDRAVPFSLSDGAPMTVQFIIEDHPMRHPWHHMARMQRALGVTRVPLADAA